MTLHRMMLTGTAGLIAIAALATGCSPSSPLAASLTPTPSSPVASSPPATAASPTSAEASPALSSPASPGNPGAAGTGCATRNLKVTVGTAQGAAGSIYQVIDFTNTSGAACTLFGYPGVALAGGT